MSESTRITLNVCTTLVLLFFALVTIVFYFRGENEISFQFSIVTAFFLLLSIISAPDVRK